MEQLELAIDLCNSTIVRVRQEGRDVLVDLDDTPAGAISLVFDAASITNQTIDFEYFVQLPSWHPVRRVSWAGAMTDYFCFALESGDSFWLQAQTLRLERQV